VFDEGGFTHGREEEARETSGRTKGETAGSQIDIP
jgi:hypothetical protein